PAADLIQALAQELRSHKYSIQHVVGIMLRSQHFYSKAAYRKRIKGPVEFSAGLARALEVPGLIVLVLALACEHQGQDLFYPPNVKGWDGGKTWINSTTVLERGNWAADVIWGNADLGLPALDAAVVDYANLLLQGDINPQARELIERAGDVKRVVQLLVNCPG